MHALFQERRYTDFLPIVLPTEERVEQMLAGTSHARDEMVGKLRPTIGMEHWHFDVEKVAVNAVMAGAAPEHFPVCSRSPRAATPVARAACRPWATWSSSTDRSAGRSA